MSVSETRNYIRGLDGVARYMDMSANTVRKKWRKWALDGRIEWPSMIEGRMYFRKDSLDKFFEGNRIVKA